MTLDPTRATFSRFDGLRLDLPLDEVGGAQAIDLLDVDWHRGVMGSREGAKAFSAKEGAGYYDRMFGATAGARETAILLARRGTTLVAFAAGTGEEVAGKTATVAAKHLSFAPMGIASGGGNFIPIVYVADQESTLIKFAGDVPSEVAFSSPTATVDGVAGKAMPKGWYVVAWPDGGNRLVVMGTANGGGPNGATSSASHVWFSNPAEPEAFESTAVVPISPGEDEDITGGCVWAGQVFVFKETRLAVFTGISSTAEGKPEFNYREVNLGTRIESDRESKYVEKIAAGRDGVYFLSNDGIYVTTGGEPALVTPELSALAETQKLSGPAETTLPTATVRWRYATQIAYMNDELWVVFPKRLLRYDLRTARATFYKTALNNICPWVEQVALYDNVARMYFSAAEGAKKIYLYTPAKDEDPTVTMDPRWQSGFYDLSNMDEKSLTNVKMWGSGKVDLEVAEDFGALGSATTYELGEGEAIGQAQRNKSQSATLFSHRLSGAAPWSIHRLSRYLRGDRTSATQKT